MYGVSAKTARIVDTNYKDLDRLRLPAVNVNKKGITRDSGKHKDITQRCHIFHVTLFCADEQLVNSSLLVQACKRFATHLCETESLSS